MSQNTVFSNVEKGRVDLFFHQDEGPNPNTSTYLKTINSQEEGLRLADQIRNATLEVWPVHVEEIAPI